MEEKRTIQDYLKGYDAQFDATNSNAIKLIRHADQRTKGKKGVVNQLTVNNKPFPSNISSLKSLYLYRHDLFMNYQSEQLQKNFKNSIKYIVSFLGEDGTKARFLEVYKINDIRPNPYKDDEIILSLEPVKAFSELSEKIIIDWGKATTSWHQYYNNNKPVIEFVSPYDRNIELPSANTYKHASLSFPQLEKIIHNPEWIERLKSVNCIYAILDNSNGKLYVGSTYNYNGILGRLESYVKTGHGDDKELKELLAKDPQYAVNNFKWTILETFPLDTKPADAINLENIWKEKLGVRLHGYCNN